MDDNHGLIGITTSGEYQREYRLTVVPASEKPVLVHALQFA
jgi:hypothetical protein